MRIAAKLKLLARALDHAQLYEGGRLVISSLDRFILPQLTNFLHGFGFAIDLTNSRFLIYGIILVMTMLFRPEGLIPSRQRRQPCSDTAVGARSPPWCLIRSAALENIATR